VARERSTLADAARGFQNLEQAFRWAIAQTPKIMPEDVVIQDEYTHDVLFRAAEDAYVVFDTT
jgi:hypothetical protein